VVAVHGHGEQAPPGDGEPLLWTALELMPGGTAARLVPRRHRLPDLGLALDVLGQAAEGLDYAHAHDVVHRDVKPANLLLSAGPRPRVVVSDFGLAQLLDDAHPVAPNGRVQGSLPYAAPEVLQAHRLLPQTDVYALACTATELLTGEPPFPRATAFAVTYAHISAPPPRLSRRVPLPQTVDDVVARALAKEPQRRHSSCLEFVRALADCVAHQTDTNT
jgi:serine/threonine-protein kinase